MKATVRSCNFAEFGQAYLIMSVVLGNNKSISQEQFELFY